MASSSIAFVMVMALFLGSAIAQSPLAAPTPSQSTALSPVAQPSAPVNTPPASAPSPVAVTSPPSPPVASPAPATVPSSIAGTPIEAPAPAPNGAAVNILSAGSVAAGLVAVALFA
ncbi:classical arabinogalactan protein 1-like [Cornus florida]|uniref:classical arabinogalactan protein 1-like n=1 Tax=Cornus florida TaxID=4283 RepID=UPI00289931A1|nr:classical arabinogalactan protein 1-like [Cornus florida]